jgi:hypothetical protein
MKFDFSNLTKIFVTDRLVKQPTLYTDARIKPTNKNLKFIDSFLPKEKIEKIKNQKLLLESVETILGNLIEEILKEHLLSKYAFL